MYERILVPLDGSPEGEAVLEPLRKILRRKDAEIVLFRSQAETALTHIDEHGTTYFGEETQASAYLEDMRLRLEREGILASTMVENGAPAAAILRAVQDHEATMIAMSTHGRSGVARLVLGSVTEEVLRRSPVPVFVASARPADYKIVPNRNPTILVPFDGTEESLSIAPLVIETARLHQASVAVLRVEDGAAASPDLGFVGILMDGPSSPESRPDLLDRDLIEAGNRFAGAGLRTTLFRVRGDTAAKINHLARILPAEMIVMASHGRQGVSRLITGSVAEEVIRKAEAPVLVQRIGASEPVVAVTERRAS
jgi:nucleotide-binding universal stress UspA family protein